MLLEYVKRYKHDWKKIQSRFNKISQRPQKISTLKNRYEDMKMGVQKKSPIKFTTEEDSKLLDGVEAHGLDWVRISGDIPSRDADSLKNRYYYLKKMNKLEINLK